MPPTCPGTDGRHGAWHVSWTALTVVMALLAAGCGRAASATAAGRSASPSVPTNLPAVASRSPTSVPSTTPAPSPHASPSTPQRATVVYVFPVAGHVSYAHTHHDYPATDIIAACGLRVRAVTAGVVLAVSRVDRYDPAVNAGATRGGLSVSILGDDGVRYYGSHLSVIEAKIAPGVRVTVGQTLGRVGATGDTSVCHLHFGISPPCARVGDWYNQRGLIWPWPYLDSWRTGGHKSPVAEVRAWRSAHGCPTGPLSDP